MSQAYDVKNMDVASSFPASAVYMVDSILSFYVIQSKMLFLQYEDFDWLLKLIHICRDGAMHHVLVYYLKLILLIRESGYDCEIQAALNFNHNVSYLKTRNCATEAIIYFTIAVQEKDRDFLDKSICSFSMYS